MPPSSPPPSYNLVSERPVHLPTKVSVTAFADVCRATVVDLMNGASRGWGKRELASWLAGPYRTLTSFAKREQRESERMIQVLSRVAAVRPIRKANRPVEISSARIDSLLAGARRASWVTLESLRDEDLGVGFVFDALNAGIVQRCVDNDGNAGWVPVDLPKLGLAERVASLIAVDYLVRPEDYAQKLASCCECGLVAFDEELLAVRRCPGHVLRSGIPAAMDGRVQPVTRVA